MYNTLKYLKQEKKIKKAFETYKIECFWWRTLTLSMKILRSLVVSDVRLVLHETLCVATYIDHIMDNGNKRTY